MVLTEIIIVLIINTIIAILCLVLYIVKKDKRRGIACAVFIFVTPAVGILCLSMALLYNAIFYRKTGQELSIEELSMSEERVKEVVDIDVRQESDKIPLKEAMLVTDRKSRRKVLLDILKRQKDDSVLQMIKEATQDEDTEVSHYAITFITDYIAKFREKEEAAAKLLEEYPSVETRIKYIKCLCEILSPGFFTDYEQEKYIYTLDEQVAILREEDKRLVTGTILSNIIKMWYDLDNIEKVHEYVLFARQICDTDLKAVKICLKYYYKTQDRKEFAKLLNELKGSALDVDSEVLDWIRFYNAV